MGIRSRIGLKSRVCVARSERSVGRGGLDHAFRPSRAPPDSRIRFANQSREPSEAKDTGNDFACAIVPQLVAIVVVKGKSPGHGVQRVPPVAAPLEGLPR